MKYGGKWEVIETALIDIYWVSNNGSTDCVSKQKETERESVSRAQSGSDVLLIFAMLQVNNLK